MTSEKVAEGAGAAGDDGPVIVRVMADTTDFDAAMKRIADQLDAIGDKAKAVGVFPIPAAGRWFIGSDGSGHTYLVPLEHYDAWNAWLELPEEQPEAWDVPTYAVRFEGELLTFLEPQLEGESVRAK